MSKKAELLKAMFQTFDKKVVSYRNDFIADLEAVEQYAGKEPLLWILRKSGTDIDFLKNAAKEGSWINACIQYNDTAFIIDTAYRLIPIKYTTLQKLAADADTLETYILHINKKAAAAMGRDKNVTV